MNKTSASEWLNIAFHDFRSAQILYEAKHFTDSIGTDLQQAIEKTMKSMLASQNKKIPKTHDLYEIYNLVDDLKFSEYEINLLHFATEYYNEDRYPNPNYSLPTRDEIERVLIFAKELFERVCGLLDLFIEDSK